MTKSKKKILAFHPSIAPYRIDLFNTLHEAFDTRICLSMRNLRSQKFDYEKIEAQFEFVPIYLKKRFTIKNRIICKGYWEQIKKHDPDIVICSEFGIDAIAAVLYKKLYNKKYKVVSVCDDSYDMIVNDKDFSTIHKFLRKYFVPKLDELILLDKDTTNWYNKHFHKGYYFPIVCDDERQRRHYEEALTLANQYIDRYQLGGKKVYLFVGRLVAIKNVSALISAFDSAKLKNSVLVIVGDGPERESLEFQKQHSPSNIIMTGRLEGRELNAWYNIASCFVLPSLVEPFGAVTNEALLGGAKAIISQKAGSRCLIDEPNNGYVFNPDNEEELSATLKEINKEIQTVEKLSEVRPSTMSRTYRDYSAGLINFLSSL